MCAKPPGIMYNDYTNETRRNLDSENNIADENDDNGRMDDMFTDRQGDKGLPGTTCKACTKETTGNLASDHNIGSDGDDDGGRMNRFVAETADMFEELKPFYNYTPLNDRVAKLRESYFHVRTHWKDFDTFRLKANKTFLKTGGEMEFKDKVTSELAQRLFTVHRCHLKREEVEKIEPDDVTFEAVQFYTTNEGYDVMYNLINKKTRKEDSIESEDLIRSVVFFVELINIDIYNYCLMFPLKNNFEGLVYRGMVLSREDMGAFRSLMTCSIDKRTFGIPLGLSSSSSNKYFAKKFIKQNMKRSESHDTPLKPLLHKYHVINLKREYIDQYEKAFPPWKLSTISAVDITDLSRYPKECEVLLSGPFVHVLDIYEEKNCLDGEEPCDVLEAVMLNTNRYPMFDANHDLKDKRARDMFTCMVVVTRSEFALRFCQEKGLLDDADQYEKYLTENKLKLQQLMDSQ